MVRLCRISLLLAATNVLASCVTPRPIPPVSRYSEAMFVRALDNDSTAPDFALITVVDAHDGKTQTVCTEASALKGALHMEFAIPYDDVGVRRVHDLALNQPDRVFRFSAPEALQNVAPGYTQKQLDRIRAMIAEVPDSDLVNKQYVDKLWKGRRGSRDAVAHALLERGISCVRGCVVGDLTPYKLR
jgi:hypothetical protein